MLLLVDAGNTMIKWAVVDSQSGELGVWHSDGAVAHADIAELEKGWRTYPISRAMISNVAGSTRQSQLAALLSDMKVQPEKMEWFASTPELAGVRNSYRNSAQLGCDRFAAMIGAHALFPEQALIVATCGTATTVDAITADGIFAGGMILPGLGLMASSLARNTAHLPQVAQNSLTFNPFANNTSDAIISGCIAAQVGAIEHAKELLAAREEHVLCVLSGGAALSIAPHLSVKHQIVDNLVLMGLHQVAATT